MSDTWRRHALSRAITVQIMDIDHHAFALRKVQPPCCLGEMKCERQHLVNGLRPVAGGEILRGA